MPTYDAIKNKQTELIRKSLDGSGFLAPKSVAVIAHLTGSTGALATLPTGYDDLGWLTDDGMAFAREVNTSDVTSFGSVTPTRSDVQTDTSTLAVSCQETKLLTIGLATGFDMSSVVPAVGGEVDLKKPVRPKQRSYRVLSLAVDINEDDGGEIYIGRFLPNAKVTGFSDQAYGSGDGALLWGVTFTGHEDSTEGYSERWLFGGPGWRTLLDAMGFPAEATP